MGDEECRSRCITQFPVSEFKITFSFPTPPTLTISMEGCISHHSVTRNSPPCFSLHSSGKEQLRCRVVIICRLNKKPHLSMSYYTEIVTLSHFFELFQWEREDELVIHHVLESYPLFSTLSSSSVGVDQRL